MIVMFLTRNVIAVYKNDDLSNQRFLSGYCCFYPASENSWSV